MCRIYVRFVVDKRSPQGGVGSQIDVQSGGSFAPPAEDPIYDGQGTEDTTSQFVDPHKSKSKSKSVYSHTT
jgi:hypothetical protein